jgi:type IV pilus assembly protein PilF
LKYLSKSFKCGITILLLTQLIGCNTTKFDTSESNRKISTAKINTQLGMAYLEQHHIQQAKRKFLIALDEAPNIPEPWYSMGYFLEVTGDKEQAKKYYQKAVALSPTRGDAQNNLGTFLCRSGDYREAIEHFQIAIKDINYLDTASAYENAGLCALKIPDKQLALLYLNKSIEQDPDRASAYWSLAELQYENKNYKKSKQMLEEFLHLSSPTKESFALDEKLGKKLHVNYDIGDA